MLTRLWEIRMLDGSAIVVEVAKERNLAGEFEARSKQGFWIFRPRYFEPTEDQRVLINTVALVQPFEPHEVKRKIALHSPDHPQKAGKRRMIVRGFGAGEEK